MIDNWNNLRRLWLVFSVALAGFAQTIVTRGDEPQRESDVRSRGGYEIIWQRTLGGPKFDSFESIVTTSSGDVIVAGMRHTVATTPSKAEKRSGWLLRLQADGTEVWNRLIDARGSGQPRSGDSSDAVVHVVPWEGAGYLAVGETETWRQGVTEDTTFIDSDGWILRFDESAMRVASAFISGPVEFSKSKGMTYRLHGAATSAQHGFAVLGTEGFLQDGTGYFTKMRPMPWMLRIGSDRQELWRKNFGFASGIWHLRDATILPDGSIICLGRARTTDDKSGAGLIIRFDQGGAEVWRRTILAPADVTPTAVELIDNDQLVLAGTARLPAAGGMDKPGRAGWIALADQAGEILTSLVISGEDPIFLSDIVALADGGFAAVGGVLNTDTGDRDGFVVTVDEALREVSRIVFGGDTNEALNGIAALPGGTLVVAGTIAKDVGSIITDGWIVALAPRDKT